MKHMRVFFDLWKYLHAVMEAITTRDITYDSMDWDASTIVYVLLRISCTSLSKKKKTTLMISHTHHTTCHILRE